MKFRQANVLPAHGPTSSLTRIVIEAIAFITSFTLGGPAMNSKKTDRRKFLQGSAALAGLAVGAAPFTSAQTLQTNAPEPHPLKDIGYGERSPFENSVRTV